MTLKDLIKSYTTSYDTLILSEMKNIKLRRELNYTPIKMYPSKFMVDPLDIKPPRKGRDLFYKLLKQTLYNINKEINEINSLNLNLENEIHKFRREQVESYCNLM